MRWFHVLLGLVLLSAILFQAFMSRVDERIAKGYPCSTMDAEHMKIYPPGFVSECVHLPRNNISLHLLDNRKTDAAKAIVFSHGLLFSTFMWTDQMKFFDEKGFRVIAYDHRGQGLSQSPSNLETIEVSQNGDDGQELIEILREKKGLKNVNFAGMSMGGFTAMRIAVQKPDLLDSLILVNTDFEPDKHSGTLKNKATSFLFRYFGVNDALAEGLLPTFFYNQDYIEKNAKKWVDYWRWNLKDGLFRTVDGIFYRPQFTRLEEIKTPTLIVHGKQDASLEFAHAIIMNEKIKGSKLVPIDKSGHQSPQEQPDAVNQAILQFLNTL